MISYFLEREPSQVGAPTVEELAKFGLDKSVCNGTGALDIEHRAFNLGPGNCAGLMFHRGKQGALAYTPSEQDWHEFATPDGRYWVGWDKSKRPEPESLLRSDWMAGTTVMLNDGKEWIIPVARLQPEIQTWTGTSWETRRDPRYDDLWALAEELKVIWEPINDLFVPYIAASVAYENAKSKNTPDLNECEKVLLDLGQKVFDAWSGLEPGMACKILATNYHVGPAEVSAMGLLTQDPSGRTASHWMLLDRFIDGEEIRMTRMAQKKT